MDWDELRDLVARGFEIGSHTVSHPHLPQLSDAELDTELLYSRLCCEDELGVPCRYLAYPYGEHDERVRAAARRAGYTAAFALHEPGPQDDPFALPRVDLYRGDSRVTATVKTSSARRPAYALAHRLRRRWPSAAPYGHGWMVATLPAAARRFRVVDSRAAATLIAAGAQVVDRDADVEIGEPAALSGEAPMAISPFAAPPHDSGALVLRVARRLYNSLRIRAVALRGRRAIRRLGYPDVEVISWDVAQTFRRPGGPAARRRSLVERLPQRALVIGRRGAQGPSLLDMVLAQASRCGASGFESAPPNMRTGGVVIVTTGDAVLRAALGAAGGQITRQLRVLDELREREPDPRVAERIGWPIDSGALEVVQWSVERRLPGVPPGAVDSTLLSDCVEFLTALHRTGTAGDEGPSLADCAAVVAPYRPRAIADGLQAVGARLDAALAHVPRGFGHGDFFTGNLLMQGGRLTGVIDWDGGGPGRLPLLDLLHLRHMLDHPLPDDDWGPSVVEYLLPWARAGGDAAARSYCAGIGLEPDGATLEALVLAYWLDRLAYQIGTHGFRRSQARWLRRSVDLVLETLPLDDKLPIEPVAATPVRLRG